MSGIKAETLRQQRLAAARLLAYDRCDWCVLVYCALVEARNDRTGRAYLSVRGLVGITGLGRKAVEASLDALQALDLIIDTGDRHRKAVVWRVVVPERTPLRNHLRPRAARTKKTDLDRAGWIEHEGPPPRWAVDEEGSV